MGSGMTVRGKRRRWGHGQTLTEYGLIMMFVALASYAAYLALGQGINAVATNAVNFISTALATL